MSDARAGVSFVVEGAQERLSKVHSRVFSPIGAHTRLDDEDDDDDDGWESDEPVVIPVKMSGSGIAAARVRDSVMRQSRGSWLSWWASS